MLVACGAIFLSVLCTAIIQLSVHGVLPMGLVSIAKGDGGEKIKNIIKNDNKIKKQIE